jgi:hypothetical protein
MFFTTLGFGKTISAFGVYDEQQHELPLGALWITGQASFFEEQGGVFLFFSFYQSCPVSFLFSGVGGDGVANGYENCIFTGVWCCGVSSLLFPLHHSCNVYPNPGCWSALGK